MKSRKLAITALLIAINVVLSSIIIIPLGPVKAAPVQHFVMYQVRLISIL